MSSPKPDSGKINRDRPADEPASKSSDTRSRETERLRRRVTSLEETNEELVRTLAVLNEFRMKLALLTEKMGMVNRLTSDLNILDVDRIVELAVTKLPLLVDARHVSVYFHDRELGRLELRGQNGAREIERQITLAHPSDTVMGIVAQTLRPILVKDLNDFERDFGVKVARTFADRYETRSCVSLPLISGNHLIGVINLADKTDGGCFDEMNDLPLLEQVSQFLAVALNNGRLFAELEEQARTDGLTRLHNHRSFYDGLTREVHRCRRYGHSLSLIMCDVDDFKCVNDRLGHRIGDRVIQLLARILRGQVRQEDLAARYGGDEFAVILPETPLVGAGVVAERIRERVDRFDFAQEGVTVPVHMSFGVAELAPGMTVADLVQTADRALYDAKASGKNRTRHVLGA